MAKIKYEVYFPKSIAQLEGQLLNLFKSRPKHIIIKIVNDYIDTDSLKDILNKYQDQIENYKKNKSIVLWSDQYEGLPDFISVAPTEEEAVDVIDFEEIERDILQDE